MEDLENARDAYQKLGLESFEPTVDPAVLLANVPQANTKMDSLAINDPQPTRTGYIFDVEMKAHRPVTEVDEGHPEGPERITGIYDILRKNGLLARMRRLEIRRVTFEEACLVHSVDHWNSVQSIAGYTEDQIAESTNRYTADSLYISTSTPKCAELSCGGGIAAALAVARGHVRTAFAIIRPPGHHAEPEKAMGFCFFSNIAVAARVVQKETAIKRILIVDWDVHHGNGTQSAFEDDPSILFISLHRYMNGDWYPGGPAGAITSCGHGAGLGKNVNIAWPVEGMGDADYLYAFTRIVLPIAYEFAPELVMISAGFDAADGDPLGLCKVTPAGFAHMTQMLTALAGGKVVALLEGGYDVDVISECALAMTRVLLGDPAPAMDSLVASEYGTETVYQVALVQSKYWKSINPKALEPAEDRQDTMSVPELLKAHRSAFMYKQYKMCTIHLASPDLEKAFGGQVLLSPDIYDRKTMLVFMHDFGNLYAELRSELYCDFNMENSYMVDASRHIVEWCQANKWSLLDINVFAKPHAATSKDEINIMKKVLSYIWDNYIELSDCKRVILVSHGSAARGVVDLVQARSKLLTRCIELIDVPVFTTHPLEAVKRLVKAVVQVASMHEPVPVPALADDLSTWFQGRSFLAISETHPTYIQKAKRLNRRYHTVKAFPDERVTQLMQAALPSIKDFVEGKVHTDDD